MTEKTVETKAEVLPDLDDLLQCPVCYEIPAGQIFQCNEGHHVCGRCKLRLDVCPVCRAYFFGTRNYAMEELIANMRKLRTFKLGGKITTGNTSSEQLSVEVKESTSEENESTNNDEDDVSSVVSANRTLVEPPRPCSGLFRCLCCKTNPERLPSARLLNHLRYFHSPELIEGRSDENGEYLQAWQFSTDEGRIATAIRISDMGLFFLVIEITRDSVFAWLVMASSPRVAEEFSYTFTLSGNDREAIFSDCVWSVRTCEGYLKKRLRCLSVTGPDARALLSPTTMSGRLSVRRVPADATPHLAQPRAVLRVANRSARSDAGDVSQELEPFLQDLQNDVARLSRAFATLGREANALVRSEAEIRARLENTQSRVGPPSAPAEPPAPRPDLDDLPAPPPGPAPAPEPAPLSRNARRRMRQRLRQAFRETQTADGDITAPPVAPPVLPAPVTAANRTQADNAARHNGQTNSVQNNNSRVENEQTTAAGAGRANHIGGNVANTHRGTAAPRTQNNQGDRDNNNHENTARANIRAPSPVHAVFSGFAVVLEPVVPPAGAGAVAGAVAGAGAASNGNGGRNKKKRRQRR